MSLERPWVDIEHHTDIAWPSPRVEQVDGWTARWTGPSRNTRPNSAFPTAFESTHSDWAPLLASVAEVAQFYQGLGGAAAFQLIEHESYAPLRSDLADRGLINQDGSVVYHAETGRVAGGQPAPSVRVEVVETPSEEWYAVWTALIGADEDAVREIRAAISIVSVPIALATAYVDDRPASVGRACLAAGYAGLYNIVTGDDDRGKGLAGAVVHALGGWAADHEAARMCLQVNATNAPARRVYDRAGFVPAYEYSYMVVPDAE